MPGCSKRRLHARSALIIAAGLACLPVGAVLGQSKEPIKIGIISEESAIAGAGISRAAQVAADEINAAGGVDGRKLVIVQYDDHSSAADAVRAFQRAVSQDGVVAVIGTYITEIALALEPWAARSHVPFITTGAASNEITRHIHDDYDKNRFTFQEYMNSTFIADSVCTSIKQFFQPKYAIKSAVVLSEDAARRSPVLSRAPAGSSPAGHIGADLGCAGTAA